MELERSLQEVGVLALELQPPLVLEETSSVGEVIREMQDGRHGCALITENKRLAGIFTERDAITKVLGAGLDPANTKISEVMSKNPFCVTPSTTLKEAMDTITNLRFRHLPVVEDGKVLGVVSSGDLTNRLVEDQTDEIRDLVNIAGRRGESRKTGH